MRIAQKDLNLDALAVVYPGEENYPLAENIQLMSLSRCVRWLTLMKSQGFIPLSSIEAAV